MTKERPKRKLSAILSADVKGYSRLMGQDELATVNAVSQCRELMVQLVQEYAGRVVDAAGDNLLAEFASVVDALDCAVKIQNNLKKKNIDLPEERRMEFRIGINLGDIIEEEERIYGDGVNIAARMQSLADGGGICISGTTYDQVENKLPLQYEYLGRKSVKNIEKPIRVYKVLMGATGTRLEKGHPPPLQDRPSIAVLPFTNMSEDKKQEYFSDGMTEDIITDLSKMSGLFVIARNSVFAYKGKDKKVEDIGRELGVQFVLEGSVRKSEDRVRISAQLIDATTGGHLWAERYDRGLKDIFDLQDEVTGEIVSALAIKLREDEHKRLLRKGTGNLEAYDCMLRGMEQVYLLSKEAYAIARQMFEKAIALDPQYALAYSLLGSTYLTEWILGWNPDPSIMAKAQELARKAISLDEEIAEAHGILGTVLLWNKKHDQAIEALQRAISLEPSNADGYATLGNILFWAGRIDESINFIRQAMQLNPHYPGWYAFRLGQAYCLAEEYDEAILKLEDALRKDPEFVPIHAFLAFAYSKVGRKKEAKKEVAVLKKSQPLYTLKRLREVLPLKDPEKLKEVLDCLREAGLE